MPTPNPPRIAVAIMAAGKGTRLKSKHPKVLHEVGGKPLLAHVIAAATQIVPPPDVYVIIGHAAARVRQAVAHTGVHFVLQEDQRGTGDAPLITPATIARLRDFHLQNKAAMTLLSADLQTPTGYGRVLRKSPKSQEVKAIVEEKSATHAQKKIHEINSGFYAFAVKPLFSRIGELTTDNAHREYYLTDMAAVFTRAKAKVLALKTPQPSEILGSNTRAEMMEIDQLVRLQKARDLMAAGASIFYPQTCVIDAEVEIGPDTIVEPFVQLLGRTRIGSDCRIRSYSVIQNSEIADRVTIRPGSILDDARVASDAVIGPYSHLRPGSDIGAAAHVGNFVETKKIKLGNGSKAYHLTYLGDAEIGSGVNVGAGTITCNYDGLHKHKTEIGDNVFVGSDSTLVAPVRIGKGAYIAAASCITEDVPEDALALGRTRQTTKEGWARAKREQKK